MVCYLGWDYAGLAEQSHMQSMSTIESEIKKALEKCQLIENASECVLEKCGRTDKGVSAIKQVILVFILTLLFALIYRSSSQLP